MPYPAYRGAQFYFDIVIGHRWRHEFSITDRTTGQPMEWTGAWTALCMIRDNEGALLATLKNDATGDGLITLTTGVLALELDAAFTANLPATTQYGHAPSKAFLWADLSLTDPDDAEPYVAARGKGVTYLPTTIGA